MSTTPTAPRQLDVFTPGQEQYALPIGTVREVVRYASATEDSSIISIDLLATATAGVIVDGVGELITVTGRQVVPAPLRRRRPRRGCGARRRASRGPDRRRDDPRGHRPADAA